MTADPGSPAPFGSRPWAFPVNVTTTTDHMEITLLAFVVVDGLVRISGLVHLRRPDLRLARAPELAMAPVAGHSLTPVGTHVLPHGDLTWVSWDFERPAEVLVAYRGHVDRLVVGDRSGPRGEVDVRGPWTFGFRLSWRRIDTRRAHGTRTRLSHPDA